MDSEIATVSGLMGVYFGGLMLFAILLFASNVFLALSVHKSAKARNASNPLLYSAVTLAGGAVAAIMYACIKKKITRTDNVAKSSSVAWLVVSCVLAFLSMIVIFATMVYYVFGMVSLTAGM